MLRQHCHFCEPILSDREFFWVSDEAFCCSRELFPIAYSRYLVHSHSCLWDSARLLASQQWAWLTGCHARFHDLLVWLGFVFWRPGLETLIIAAEKILETVKWVALFGMWIKHEKNENVTVGLLKHCGVWVVCLEKAKSSTFDGVNFAWRGQRYLAWPQGLASMPCVSVVSLNLIWNTAKYAMSNVCYFRRSFGYKFCWGLKSNSTCLAVASWCRTQNIAVYSRKQ